MSRIATRFAALKEQGRTALIPFVTAGDPEPSVTVDLMHKMVESGADLIELGVPFSDPMADGPAIQRANERALVHNVSLHQVMDMVTAFRQKDNDTPVILMGYLNPIEVLGYAEFAKEAHEKGVDGVITVDIPPEEGSEFVQEMRSQDIDPIFLLAPTSNEARIEKVTAAASGFVYYVSLKGVTGAATLVVDTVRDKLAEIRAKTDLPLGVGFGIKDAAMAKAMSEFADAVVVGSALVNRVEANAGDKAAILSEVGAILSEMRQAMDA